MAISELFSAGTNAEKRRAEAWLASRLERGKTEAFAEIAEITPLIAEMLLGGNPENRRVSSLHVAKIARDISNGRYKLNGQPIIIANTGDMNDGQHRSHGIIEAGKSIRSFVVFGVERESRDTLDIGKKRTVGDFLGMAGYENSNQLATALKYVIQLERGGKLTSAYEARPTEQEQIEAAALHKTLPQSFERVPTRNIQVYGGRSLLAFSHYVFSFYDPDKADEFMQRLLDGVGLEPRHPVYTLREWFHRSAGQNLSPQDRAIRIFRAWQHFKDDKPLQVLKPGGGDLRECLQ